MLNLIHYYYIAHPFNNYFYSLLIFKLLNTQKVIITKSKTLPYFFLPFFIIKGFTISFAHK
ncbi:hypothetical protein FLCU109888_13420 [Flavobacterium cucumis]|uniref:Uncharacterized protein n=1 Tax=Flavobacterium cucumis TaxID=416016 RepID=A0A1M7ZYN4_9FLAO|nr:hypothetical protein SAMN05443547_2350 [Flavobacterium cucumis]